MKAAHRTTLALASAVLCCTVGCSNGGTSPFDRTFVALVYGRVTRAGDPVSGLNVRGDVYTTTCPSSALQQTSTQSAQTGPDGRYRMLLSSTSPDAGQCLALTVGGAQPELHTLDHTSFTAEFPGPAKDSVQVDVSVP